MIELDKTYNPKDSEKDIYSLWEKSGAFTPKIPSGAEASDPRKKPFCIMMPPPNVTGRLHIGHAMFITLEDILTRYHRMKGEPTLWLPGTDHAGIATQAVVEKALRKEGKTKKDLGREGFVKRVWEWKKEFGGEIIKQTRGMGASCDWSRERFTLDEGMSAAVNEAFVQLYRKELIYRGLRVVNWCPRCQTAIADDEVEHETQNGKFYYLKYDKNFPIVIATTRPETKLGDVAVAVNPKDDRYKQFVGKTFKIDLDGVKREIIIITDRAVDPKVGTGAVGVTPAHSYIDWQMAQANDLPTIAVINEFARMTKEAGKYDGLKVSEAREKLVEYLRTNNLLSKEEEIENNLSICERCGGQIEPIPSKQWFVKMKPLAKAAKEAVESGKIKIVPKRFEKIYFHWIDNIRDWCISRQLWWGHRIPVWYKKELKVKSEKLKVKTMGIAERVVPQILAGKTKTYRIRDHELKVGDKVYFENSTTGEIFGYGIMTESTKTKVRDLPLQDKAHGAIYDNVGQLIEAFKFHNPEKEVNPDTDAYIYAYDFTVRDKFENSDIENSLKISNLKLKISKDDIYVGVEPPKDIENWTQEEDVLDTWFSSALWPFSTLGWPKQTEDYKYFYPTTILETGYDILPAWVSKMIMMGLELTNEVPFKTVYLHGLVRDEQNRKMSKSLGNGIDPLDVSEKYGTDAVRMSLIVGATAGNDIAVGESKIKGYRNFSNKIWNISRFILMNLESEKEKIKFSQQDKKDFERLDTVITETTKHLDLLQFSRAGELLYDFVWHEFADIMIEEAKPRLQSDLAEDRAAARAKLVSVLVSTLKMLHPFVPYVTETIWQKIPKEFKDSDNLISAKWPKISS